MEFVMRAVNSDNFVELCREYGISRKTGYKWRERFVEHGLAGLEEESRRPHGHSEALEERVVCDIIRLKNAHMHWGPRKIRELYRRKRGGEPPSESSFKRVMERAGLIERRRRRVAREGGRLSSGRKAQAPNEVWTTDFKGWWIGGLGERVEPLTVRDEYSRMILELKAVENARTETIRSCFEELFERHGLPGAIRSDNGTPFASYQAVLGLSRLSAWWLALGIDLERSRPGCPQDNGAHERLHLDIRRELQAGRIGRDQEAFDLWRHQYNTERPHDSLAMACPAEIYRPSERLYTGTPEELDYGGMQTRQVTTRQGTIKFQRETIKLSTALGGWNVGLAPQQNGLVEVWFSSLLLGHIDPQTAAFTPLHSPKEAKRTGLLADSATLHRPTGRQTIQVQTSTKTCNL